MKEYVISYYQPSSSIRESANETDSNLNSQAVIKVLRTLNELPQVETYVVTKWDIFFNFLSIFFRFLTIILNILLAVKYYKQTQFNYFVWTICCILIPMVVTTFICINMYIEDKLSGEKKYNTRKIVFNVVLFPFLFRYCQSLSYALSSFKARKIKDIENQKRFYNYMIQEESDVALIRLFESFFEAAPQKVLQFAIILSSESIISWYQIASIISCLFSLAWCMVAYHKSNRFCQPDKERISLVGILFQCFWHFCITVSRVVSIALIASLFPLWTLVACLIRTSISCALLTAFEKPAFCATTILHTISFTFVLGVVYIFAYIAPKEGSTRIRFIIYYFICFLENVTCAILFLYYYPENFRFYNLIFILAAFATIPFILGIILMIIYYCRFHPNITAKSSTYKT